MAKDERGGVLGLAPEIAETGAEVLEMVKDVKIPGLSFAAAVLERAFASAKERRAREFFTRLAVSLGCNDPDEAASEVARNLHESWAEEAVDRGYRLMMSTAHESMRPAIAALVAEQFIERTSLGRDFQRVGALLVDCVPIDVALLLQVSDLVEAAARSNATGDRVLVRSSTPSEREMWVVAWRGPGDSFYSDRFAQPDAALTSCGLLTRHGFGATWTGLGSSTFKGSPIAYFEKGSDSAFRLLRRCLGVVARAETPAGVPTE
ncbi:MAG TPA: hypothetical protein VGM44_01565 [Polyangiaceae bacterium]|jgi:hypothetical protein